MVDLKKMWTCDGFLVDENGDSVPDGVRVEVVGISETCMPVGLIDFYARLGLETTALSLPFTKNSSAESSVLQLSIDTDLGDTVLVQIDDKKVVIRGGDEAILSGLLCWLASSWPQEIPKDWVSKQIIQLEWKKHKYRVNFSDNEQSNWMMVPSKIVTRAVPSHLCGLQNLWTVQGFYQGGRVDLNSRLNVGFTFENALTSEVLLSAADFAARMGLCSTGIQFPLTGEMQPELGFVIRLNHSSSCEVSWDVNKVYLTGGEQSVVNALNYLAASKRYEEGGTFALWELAVKQRDSEQEPLIYEKSWYNQGEREDLLNLIKKEKAADQVIVYISEPAEVRAELAEDISVRLAASEVRVRSAFKPGYFWIEEEIMPLLIGKQIGRIHIVCKKNNHGLEMANRWIQELYPIDEILSQHLLMTTDQVEFFLEDREIVYEFRAYDLEGNCIVHETLEVPTIEMDYINGKSKIFPTTGMVQLYRNGALANQYHNPTDRERFWLFFMNEVLPELIEFLPLENDGRGTAAPFFSRLLVEVFMSEEERKLGIEEERISSLEALHEDIYFNVLDYFEHLGEQKAGVRWDAPGGVHPFMHVKQGSQPSAKIKLYGFTPQENVDVFTKVLVFSADSKEPVSCVIQSSTGEERRLLHEEWGTISLPQWNEEIGTLANLKGVHIWMGGTSYENRAIPVLDVLKPTSEEFYSPHKLSLYKPTILIETGHHANEVSSSPAVREMIREIVEERQDLLNKVNIIVIPCANPDGSHLHSLLAADNPEWKHHAARYNAVGLEYSHVRYKNTIFGEADVVPNAIHRWLPDVMIDGHGIPGHEWIQPFAGFNSPPRFPVSYTIPNAFIYGITRELDKNHYPGHQRIQDALISGITEKISEMDLICTKNEYWRNRYRKYGTQWVPDSFPIEEQDGMNFYHWDTKVDRESSVYLSRYPEWCSADFITEAADETVYGDTLAGCMMAQKAFNLGVIENMAECIAKVKVSSDKGYIKTVRKRPLQKG